MKIIRSAMPIAASGTIRGSVKKNSKALFPAKLSRASSRATGRQMARQIAVTTKPMKTVFTVASQTRL